MARNLSPQQMFIRMVEAHQPIYGFSQFNGDFQKWKAMALPEVLKTLGRLPVQVSANAELVYEWLDREIIKRRFLLEVGPHISASVQVNIPANRADGEALPALLCWHGHGPHGKDPIMGNLGSVEIRQEIEQNNSDYGHQMATKGFVTYALDWMGCGERSDQVKPHFLATAAGRDWCNLYYLHATMLGMTPLGINLAHGRAATNFVCDLPEVDASRLGVMGMSGGGTMTLWTALLDDRFRAAEIVCYSDLFALFGIRDINYCGSQVAPGLFELVDLPDLQGLLAPLPLLIDIGVADRCFQADNAMRCFQQLEAIYSAAKAGKELHLDFFAGGHAWGANKSDDFFRKYLTL